MVEFLVFGFVAVLAQNVDVLVYRCLEEAKKGNLLRGGDKVVISAGVPLDVAGNTNMIRVENV